MNIGNNIKNFLYDRKSYVLLYENNLYIYGNFKIIFMSTNVIELESEDELLTINGKDLNISKSIDKEMLIIGTINEIKK